MLNSLYTDCAAKAGLWTRRACFFPLGLAATARSWSDAHAACAADRAIEKRAPNLLRRLTWNLIAVGRNPQG